MRRCATRKRIGGVAPSFLVVARNYACPSAYLDLHSSIVEAEEKGYALEMSLAWRAYI
jgi:hypothetical protein